MPSPDGPQFTQYWEQGTHGQEMTPGEEAARAERKKGREDEAAAQRERWAESDRKRAERAAAPPEAPERAAAPPEAPERAAAPPEAPERDDLPPALPPALVTYLGFLPEGQRDWHRTDQNSGGFDRSDEAIALQPMVWKPEAPGRSRRLTRAYKDPLVRLDEAEIRVRKRKDAYRENSEKRRAWQNDYYQRNKAAGIERPKRTGPWTLTPKQRDRKNELARLRHAKKKQQQKEEG